MSGGAEEVVGAVIGQAGRPGQEGQDVWARRTPTVPPAAFCSTSWKPGSRSGISACRTSQPHRDGHDERAGQNEPAGQQEGQQEAQQAVGTEALDHDDQ